MEASWNTKSTDVDNVWTLGWGAVQEDDSLTAISLRSAAPMHPPVESET